MLTNFKHSLYNENKSLDPITFWSGINTIITDDDLSTHKIENTDRYKYRGNFYGLLMSISIPQQLWYPILMYNGYKTSTDYNQSEYIILIDQKKLLDFYNKKMTITGS